MAKKTKKVQWRESQKKIAQQLGAREVPGGRGC